MNAYQSFLARLLKTLLTNFTSRKFLMTLFALYAEWCIYWAVVASLYTIKDPAQIAAFVSITQHFQWTVATILLAYLGVQTATNFSSAATQATQNLVQNAASFSKSEVKETREDIQRIIKENEEKYLNDPSYAPIKKDTEVAFR
jgi:hypothetical protein